MKVFSKINMLMLGLFFLSLFTGFGTTNLTSAAPVGASLDGEEQAAIAMINDYRRANGLGDLQVDFSLEIPVRWKVQDMATQNYFSHIDSQGRDPYSRMADFGVFRDFEGEDLSAGLGSAGEVINQWINSPAHNDQLLTAEYTKIGIARFYQDGSTYGWYWALNVSN